MAWALDNRYIGKVDQLIFMVERGTPDKYSLADIEKVIKCLPAINKLMIDLTDLPKDIKVQHWKTAADMNANLEYMLLVSWGSRIDKECEYELGRLVTRAKTVAFTNIGSTDMDLFFKGVQQELEEKTANCEQMYFDWSYSVDFVEKFKDKVKQLGWFADIEDWTNEGKLYMNSAFIKSKSSVSPDDFKDLLSIDF